MIELLLEMTLPLTPAPNGLELPAVILKGYTVLSMTSCVVRGTVVELVSRHATALAVSPGPGHAGFSLRSMEFDGAATELCTPH